MGQLISLAARLDERRHEGPRRRPVACFIAFDCPISYLIADRVERDFGEVSWVPALSPTDPRRLHERLVQSRRLADAARVALVEPEVFPFDPRPVTRAAAAAVSLGLGGGFTLAALRLAFAGGFDLTDPDVIAEAGAASGIDPDVALAAAGDPGSDPDLISAGLVLSRRGITEGSAIRVGTRWFAGLEALHRSAAFRAAQASHLAGGIAGLA